MSHIFADPVINISWLAFLAACSTLMTGGSIPHIIIHREVSMFRKEHIPNIISTARLVITVPILSLLYLNGQFVWFLIATLLLAASDWIDGKIAKTFNWVTHYGKIVDPFADKVWGWTMKVIVTIEHGLTDVFFWPLVVFAVYDTGTFLMRCFATVESANEFARWKTTVLMLSLVLLSAAFLESPWKNTFVTVGTYLFLVAVPLALISAGIYIQRNVRLPALG